MDWFNWFLSLDTFNKIFLCFVILFIFSWFIDTFGLRWYRNNHPKYRKNDKGLVEYYSLYYNCWRIYYIWNSSIEDRVLHIHDTIRGLEYNLKYKGEGRSAIKYEDLNFWTWKYKKIKDIDDHQNKLIDIEDQYLKDNILNK